MKCPSTVVPELSSFDLDSAFTFLGKQAMSDAMRELGIDRWTSEQRISLALEIWESLENERPSGLTSPQLAELARRDAELEANPGLGLSWEQIRTTVEGSL
jgi:putative addiction module component (TIGR02574 family)